MKMINAEIFIINNTILFIALFYILVNYNNSTLVIIVGRYFLKCMSKQYINIVIIQQHHML